MKLDPRYRRWLPPFNRCPNVRRRTELGLLIYACGITVALYLIASFAQESRIPPHIGYFFGIVLGLALLAHVGNRWLAPESSPVLLPLVFLLNGIGYVVIAVGIRAMPRCRPAGRPSGSPSTWSRSS